MRVRTHPEAPTSDRVAPVVQLAERRHLLLRARIEALVSDYVAAARAVESALERAGDDAPAAHRAVAAREAAAQSLGSAQRLAGFTAEVDDLERACVEGVVLHELWWDDETRRSLADAARLFDRVRAELPTWLGTPAADPAPLEPLHLVQRIWGDAGERSGTGTEG